tara:strand:- start:22449 stop:23423 length:975 start_codon:yes stop_codon:yes gene_type:complete
MINIVVGFCQPSDAQDELHASLWEQSEENNDFSESMFSSSCDYCDLNNFDRPNGYYGNQRSPLEQLSFLAAIDGSKQPQDYGVNADLGMRFRANYAAPLVESYGLGFQVGSAVNWTDNAVRVFELMGEDSTRFQNHTTVGIFQRVSYWGWGVVYDHLYQDGFDATMLGQLRGQLSINVSDSTQVGLMGRFRAFDDIAEFNGSTVTLRSINQGSIYVRQFFETGVQLTGWFGAVDAHGESNGAFGSSPARNESFVFGADFVAPLNSSLALYGETNLVTPADTGTVDAFFGMVWYPFTNAKYAHRKQYAPMFSVAAPTSFSVDLLP